MLRRGPLTLAQLAQTFGVCARTIRRDVLVLELCGVAIGREDDGVEAVWFIGSMPEWPRAAATPVTALSAGKDRYV